MKKIAFALLVLLCTMSILAVEWNFNGTRASWDKDRHLTATVSQEGLVLDLTDSYSNIETMEEFSPAGCEVMVIKYQATGLKRNQGGQIYFGTKEDPTLDENKKFYVKPLNFDNEEHDLYVNLKSAAREKSYEIWSNASKICDVRIDLVNEFPAHVVIKSIGFITVEQYENLLKSKYEKIGIPTKIPVYLPNGDPKSKTALKNGDAIFESDMYSPKGANEYSGILYLRYEFNLDAAAKKNIWQSVCDDEIENLWINGQKVSHKWSTDWQVMDTFEIPNEMFNAGRNVIAIAYRNNGNIGGIMADLQILDKNGKYKIITPKRAVGYFGEQQDGWQKPSFKCNWEAVDSRPGPPAAPWVNFSPFYKSLRTEGNTVSIEPLKMNRFAANVKFTGSKKFSGNDVFYARFCTNNGIVLSNINGTIKELNGKVNKDGSVTIQFHAFKADRYGSGAECRWEFGVKSWMTEGQGNYDIKIQDRKVPGDPITVKLAQTANGPVPLLNGKPYYFNVLTVHNYSNGYDGVATGMEGRNSPFNVIAIRLGGSGDTNWWVGPDEYDFTSVDRNLSLMLERYPDSNLALYVWCHPNNWYTKKYPERISLQEDGGIYQYYVSPVSFSNAEVRKDAQKAIYALVKHIEKYFGSRTVLYNLMGGISCEWQGWSSHSDNFSDYSPNGIQDFMNYAAALNIPVNGMPSGEARKHTDTGVFRNPVTDKDAILYDKFYSESIANCINDIAAAAKQACNNTKLVGTYYGYLMEYANLGYGVNGGGHNAMYILLNSPFMDFFLSPQSYGIRSFGAPNGEMKPYGAIRAAGKLSMLEDDTRTHLTEKTDFEQTLNLPLTLNILKRNIGMSLSRNTPLNHLPLVGGNELADPNIRALFGRTLKVGQYLMEHGHNPDAEIAAVIDEEAIRYLAYNRTKVAEVPDESRYLYNHDGSLREHSRYVHPIYGEQLYYQRINLAQIGAPVDTILLPDVIKNPAKYKLVIFLNAYKDKPMLRKAMELLRQNNVKVIVMHGAGFIDEKGFSVETLSTCVGMKMAMAEPGGLRLRVKDGNITGNTYDVNPRFKVVDKDARVLGNYVDSGDAAVATKGNMIFYGGALLDSSFARKIASASGVHIFTDSGDNLYASKDIISIHANKMGHKVIHLKEPGDVIDIYTGQIMPRNGDTIEFDMQAFETRVFLIGNANTIINAIR